MKRILFFMGICLINTAYSQSKQEPCSFDKAQAKLEAKNPEIKRARLEAEARLLATDIQKYLKDQSFAAKNTNDVIYEIPVVVHLMNDGTTPMKSDAEIITWINNCNKFYNTTYGGEWYSTSQGGNIIPFKLVLAKRNAACNATTGIVQVNVTATYPQYSTKGLNSDNTDGVTEDQIRALSRWDTNLYYNIYVVNTFDSVPLATTSGLQGYAGFPTNSDATFDTFMKASVVTNTSDPTTLPHEFGHSMGLHHPFNTGSETACPTVTSGGCATDNDMVCDTPSTKNLLSISASALPTNSSTNPCDAAGWNNVQYNVMNYTASNRLFTLGQKNRATTMFLQNRKILTKSLCGIAPSTSSSPTIAATTCIPPTAPSLTGDYNFGPTLVKIGDLENVSDASNSANNNKVYYDYTSYSCTSTAYKTTISVLNNPQTLTVTCSTNINKFSAWIDYNNNGSFETNEQVVNNQSVNPSVNTNLNFNIPTSGVTLNTPLRMRVIADSNNISSPCAQIARGQVEDYEVTITNTSLSVQEGDIKQANFTLYPNPSENGLFNIRTEVSTLLEIQIMDASGRIVFKTKQKAQDGIINIDSKLSKGYYVVQINGEGISKNEKLIIK